MSVDFMSILLSKIPLPPSPYFTNDVKKDLEILTIFKENLNIYLDALRNATTRLFTTAITNSRPLKTKISDVEEMIKAIDKDISRLSSGFSIKFIFSFIGPAKSSLRVSKAQLTRNFNSIKDSSVTYVEDGKLSVFILKLNNKNDEFPITECPCCDLDSIHTKEELISHIRFTHITCKKYAPDKSKAVFVRIPSEPLNDEKVICDPHQSTVNNLTDELEEIFEISSPNEDFINLKDSIIDFIKKRLQIQLPNCELVKYGSSGNGFSTYSSDIDLCLVYNLKNAFKQKKFFKLMSNYCGGVAPTKDLCELIILSKACNMLASGGEKVIDLELRGSTRVRIINFKTPTEPQFEVDICINNKVAIENTKLLKAYSLINDRVVKLGVIVKLWSKALDISNPHNGTLSSYAYMLLVINFFQNTNPPILPFLQVGQSGITEIDGVDCSFDSNYIKYVERAMENKQSTGELLLKFFNFYSNIDWTTVTIDIRMSGLKSKAKKFEDCKISIQDPFEVNRNLGDVIKNNEAYHKIVNSFKRTYKELCKGSSLTEVLRFNKT